MSDINNRSKSKILIIAAHPDDIELSCGGSIPKWKKDGREVIYTICTNGNKGSKDPDMSPYVLAEMRENEQRDAANFLGVDEVTFLRHNDGELENNFSFRAELALLIRHYQPHIVATHDPWRPYQLHPDHRAVGFTTTDAIVSARDHLFHPEFMIAGFNAHVPSEIYYFHTDTPDYYVDITDTVDIKLTAISFHKSQIKPIPTWKDRIRERAARIGEKAGMPFAEGFKRIAL